MPTQEDMLIELFKAMSDHLKHVTTLASGFSLVMIALLEKLIVNPQWRGLVVVAFVAFTLAILFSVVAQVYWISFIRQPLEYEGKKYSNVLSATTFSAWGGFLIGVLALIGFALSNLT